MSLDFNAIYVNLADIIKYHIKKDETCSLVLYYMFAKNTNELIRILEAKNISTQINKSETDYSYHVLICEVMIYSNDSQIEKFTKYSITDNYCMLYSLLETYILQYLEERKVLLLYNRYDIIEIREGLPNCPAESFYVVTSYHIHSDASPDDRYSYKALLYGHESLRTIPASFIKCKRGIENNEQTLNEINSKDPIRTKRLRSKKIPRLELDV